MPSGDIDGLSNAGQTGDYKTNGYEKWFTCALSGFNFPRSRMVRLRGKMVADIFADEHGRDESNSDPRVLDMEDIENPYGF